MELLANKLTDCCLRAKLIEENSIRLVPVCITNAYYQCGWFFNPNGIWSVFGPLAAGNTA